MAEATAGEAGADLMAAAGLARRLAGDGARLTVVAAAPDPDLDAVSWVDVSGGEQLDNRAVTSASVRDNRVFARVSNFSPSPAEVPLSVEVDGTLTDETTVPLGPGESVDAVWALPPGSELASVAIAGDDELPIDDVAIVSVSGRVRMGQLVGESAAVERALAALDGWRIRRVGRATFAVDESVELSVFVGVAPDRLPPGGVVIVAPWRDDPTAPQLRLHTELVAGAHPVTRGLDLSGVTALAPTSVQPPPWGLPVITGAGEVLAYAGATGQSRVVAVLIDPDDADTNLSRRSAFPLLMARAVDWLSGPVTPGAVAVGEVVPLPGGAFAVTRPDGTVAAAEGAFEASRPGLYSARRGGNSPLILQVGAHSGDDRGSDLRGQSTGSRVAPSAESGNAPAAGATATSASGERLAPRLAIVALAIVMVEGAWRTRPPTHRARVRR
jgi:hypothetical protein